MRVDARGCADGRPPRAPAGPEPVRGRYRGAAARAFTLLEILLALALLGLLSAALVTGAVHLVSTQPQSAEEVFWAATRAARREALTSQQPVTLSFDSKEKQFVLGGRSTAAFAIPSAPRDLTVDLLAAQSGGGTVLIGGQLVDTETLPSVSFYPDGTCTPFRVQFRTSGPAQIIAIDPWTCAPMLKMENAF